VRFFTVKSRFFKDFCIIPLFLLLIYCSFFSFFGVKIVFLFYFIIFYNFFIIVSQIFFIVFISLIFLIRFLLSNIKRLKNKFDKKINVFVFKIII